MRNSLTDVVAAALRVLDEQGLENCSMRRVAAALDVQPSALYHHVPNKQTLLALMADEIVRGVAGAPKPADAPATPIDLPANPAGAPAEAPEAAEARGLCRRLRAAMLEVRDGAEVVATASAFRLGASQVEDRLAGLVGADGARTLLLFTFGHTQSTQTHRQAAELGALGDPETSPAAAGSPADLEASFDGGLDIILRGLGG